MSKEKPNYKPFGKTHNECRKLICLLCFGKSKEMRKVNKNQEIVIRKKSSRQSSNKKAR